MNSCILACMKLVTSLMQFSMQVHVVEHAMLCYDNGCLFRLK